MSWLIPFSDLTPDQQRAVQLGAEEHRAIVGGPGSGKTQVLLHRAKHMREALGVPDERFRIFVFTNLLKTYIRSALRDLGLPEENVTTFDQWCRVYYTTHIGKKLPWNAEDRQPDFVTIRQGVIRHAGQAARPLFDFILVDEAHDLDEEIIALLPRISRHVTVCVDNKQQIYDNGTTEAGVLYRLGIRKRNVNLIEAFRVCPYLVRVAAELIPDAEERQAFLNQNRQPQTERQTPLLYFAINFEDEKQMMHRIVSQRLMKNERIAILFPENRQVHGFAKGLHEAGIQVEVPEQRVQTMPAYDFSSARPKVMTYHSAKGLTFDSVLMPRLVRDCFSRTSDERAARLLFVAVTRATRWCYFSTNVGRPLNVLEDKLVPLAKTGNITLGDHTMFPEGGSPDSGGNDGGPDDGNDLDFL